MRARGAIIHQSAGCAAEIAALIQTNRQFLSCSNFFLTEAVEADVSTFFFSDLNLLLLNKTINDAAGAHGLVIEKIVQFLIVDL